MQTDGMADARWNLPTVDLAHRETFEHCALRVLDRQVGLHALPPTAALLRTKQTVPTDVLPNGGEHTITLFMGLWVKEDSKLEVRILFFSNHKLEPVLTSCRQPTTRYPQNGDGSHGII